MGDEPLIRTKAASNGHASHAAEAPNLPSRPAETPCEAPIPLSEECSPSPAQASQPTPCDLDSPDLYLNRELTWLEFNRRVLHEAEDDETPLLERVKFIAIVASNLDEFFMKRIGGLKQQVGAGVVAVTVDGRTAQEQIDESLALVRQLEDQRRRLYWVLLEKLEEHGIRLSSYAHLSEAEQQALRHHYFKNIFPLVTPQAMDPAHPFPFISNLSVNLLVTVRYPKDPETSMARVKVPVGGGIPRLLPAGEPKRFVLLEDVMAHNLDLLFPSMQIDSCDLFRVTRNANTEGDEDHADDLLALIESELRERRLAPIVRLEVTEGMAPRHRGMLTSEFALDARAEVFEVAGMLGMRDLMELTSVDDPSLHDPPHHPIDHPRLQEPRNIFHIIRDTGSILLQHPYESYTSSVERFLREASEDPKVRAIKMTLYRTSADSNIFQYLAQAAENGKQVAVVVELKARFDEAANISFANRLEEFGIHVTYGVVGLKTHCKVILVVRQDYNGLRRYAHISTGNYHAGTARIYSDFGLFSCDEALGEDLTELFNYLTTGYRPKRNYRKILPAPTMLKKALLAKIEREIRSSSPTSPGRIQLKMNALEDFEVTRALYRASQAGIHIDLMVRDTCRLRPGIPGVSDNIRVVSIVGRFLEHARIYYFHNGGDEEYLLGSADCMKRNLEHRVEVVVGIEDPALRADLRKVMDLHMADGHNAWEMRSDGTYFQHPTPAGKVNYQELLIQLAEKRHRQASRLRKRPLKGFTRHASS